MPKQDETIHTREACVNWMPERSIPVSGCNSTAAVWYAHCVKGRTDAYCGMCYDCNDWKCKRNLGG